MHARLDVAERPAVRPGTLDRACLVAAALTALLLIVKLVLIGNLAGERRAVTQGQQRLAQTQLLAQVNNRLIQMLATASAQTGDAQLRDLLAANGVRFSITPRASPAATATTESQPPAAATSAAPSSPAMPMSAQP